MFDVVQSVIKRIELPEGWQGNNGKAAYALEAMKASESINNLFNDPNIEVVSLETVCTIKLKHKSKVIKELEPVVDSENF